MITHIQKVDKKILNEIKSFYKCYYATDNRIFTSSYLEWLLLENPFGIGYTVHITLDNEIISNMFLIPISLIKSGVEKKGYYVVEVLSHPNHRDKNLFIKMIRATIQKVQEEEKFLIGHPNSQAFPGWKRTKMKFQPEIFSYLSKPSLSILKIKKDIINSEEKLSKLEQSIKDLLYEKRNLIVNSNYHFINWRYLKHPSKKYKIEAIYMKKELIGLIVSYKYKKIIDRVVHYIVKENKESYIFNSSLIPKIHSFQKSKNLQMHMKSFFMFPIGMSINNFYTEYTPNSDEIDTSYITYAACDN